MWGFLSPAAGFVMLTAVSSSEDLGMLVVCSDLCQLPPICCRVSNLMALMKRSKREPSFWSFTSIVLPAKEKGSIPETCALFSSWDHLWDFTREVFSFPSSIPGPNVGVDAPFMGSEKRVMAHSGECPPSSYAPFFLAIKKLILLRCVKLTLAPIPGLSPEIAFCYYRNLFRVRNLTQV